MDESNGARGPSGRVSALAALANALAARTPRDATGSRRGAFVRAAAIAAGRGLWEAVGGGAPVGGGAGGGGRGAGGEAFKRGAAFLGVDVPPNGGRSVDGGGLGVDGCVGALVEPRVAWPRALCGPRRFSSPSPLVPCACALADSLPASPFRFCRRGDEFVWQSSVQRLADARSRASAVVSAGLCIRCLEQPRVVSERGGVRG